MKEQTADELDELIEQIRSRPSHIFLARCTDEEILGFLTLKYGTPEQGGTLCSVERKCLWTGWHSCLKPHDHDQ